MEVTVALDLTRLSQSEICRMVILFFETTDSKQTTKLTYHLLIQKPVTEYAIFFLDISQIQKTCEKSQREIHTHITLNVGASIKAYHVMSSGTVQICGRIS